MRKAYIEGSRRAVFHLRLALNAMLDGYERARGEPKYLREDAMALAISGQTQIEAALSALGLENTQFLALPEDINNDQ